jgi:hypothetical protein
MQEKNYFNCTGCKKATEEKVGLGNYQWLSFFLETTSIKEHRK